MYSSSIHIPIEHYRKQYLMMKKIIVLLFLIFECVVVSVNSIMREFLLNFTNIRLSTEDLIKRDGYAVENHEVETDDGYLIKIQRIAGKSDSVPVLILHGLCADSHIWVINGRNHSLPYLLADSRFDVWLGNIRGNSYGKKHVKLSPNDKLFWHFSIEEIGMYDLPGIISYIYKLTHQKLVIIGYSMNANSGLIMNIKRHDMDVKIRLMIHLGPPVFMNSAPVASHRLVHHSHGIKQMFDSVGIYEWPPGHSTMNLIIKNGCGSNNIVMKFCEEVLLRPFNFDRDYIDHPTLEMIINHITDTTSVMVIIHFMQWINSGRFQPYDYGIVKNLIKYKNIVPPDYDLMNITVPTGIFYTEHDAYVSSKAINKLYRLLPKKIGLIKVESSKFSHLHFGFARNARDLVYEKMIKMIKKFS